MVKGEANANNNRNLLNYKIQRTDYGSYFITERSTFETVEKLIHFYQDNDGLKTRLKTPILREKEEGRERDQWEVRKESVQKTKLIGSGHFGEVCAILKLDFGVNGRIANMLRVIKFRRADSSSVRFDQIYLVSSWLFLKYFQNTRFYRLTSGIQGHMARG